MWTPSVQSVALSMQQVAARALEVLQALAAVHLDLIDARACVNHQPPASPQVPLSIASRMPTSHGTQKVSRGALGGIFR